MGQLFAMRIALFEPEIAGNVGAVLRLGACFGAAVDLIEPLGFVWDDRRVRRAAMDYIDHVEVVRHAGFAAFRETVGPARLVLFDISEAALYEIQMTLADAFPRLPLTCVVGDVKRDERRPAAVAGHGVVYVAGLWRQHNVQLASGIQPKACAHLIDFFQQLLAHRVLRRARPYPGRDRDSGGRREGRAVAAAVPWPRSLLARS